MRGNVAVRPAAVASAPGNDFPFDDDRPRGVPPLINLSFPAKLSGARVDGDYKAIRSRVVNHIVVDGQGLRSGRTVCRTRGWSASAALLSLAATACGLAAGIAGGVRRRPLILPNKIAIRGVKRLDRA